jgi:hypothetical protein
VNNSHDAQNGDLGHASRMNLIRGGLFIFVSYSEYCLLAIRKRSSTSAKADDVAPRISRSYILLGKLCTRDITLMLDDDNTSIVFVFTKKETTLLFRLSNRGWILTHTVTSFLIN